MTNFEVMDKNTCVILHKEIPRNSVIIHSTYIELCISINTWFQKYRRPPATGELMERSGEYRYICTGHTTRLLAT
jgi:hypothetical protein